ncbi:hypothetical protein NF27_DT01120 [Candidatus Jidaibacter acanthamoeba]|uniref:Uncharacterized protein n=1 Tax=Candidatus Jidaibacter acanthamoebae TaxID=86105 RepID=A0A0C1QMR4_9RICK|nr:hypothetical protein [Candidatus Jidaibacter acanthamoeba]KIE05338.1 hypothetical protein NF27_DT01120 [Candidatus Jidaibacter acanthamoeba]
MENNQNIDDAYSATTDNILQDEILEIYFHTPEYDNILNCHKTVTSSDINQYLDIFANNTPSLTEQLNSHLSEEYIRSFLPSYESLNTLGSITLFIISVYSNPHLTSSLIFIKMLEDLLEINSQDIINYFGFKANNIIAFKRFITNTRLSAGAAILGINISPITGKKLGAGISAAAIDSVDNILELLKLYIFPDAFIPHEQMDIFSSGLYFQLKKSTEEFSKPVCEAILRNDEKWLMPKNNIFLDTMIKEYAVVGTSKIIGTEIADFFDLIDTKKETDIHSLISLEVLTKSWLNIYNKDGYPYFSAIPLVMKQMQKFLFRDLQ